MKNQETKICIKCEQERNIGEFYERKNSKDGLNNMCKICYVQKGKKRYLNHKDEILSQQKQHYLECKDEILSRQKQYNFKNKDKIALYHKQHHLEHKEEDKTYHQQWYVENRDEIFLQQKQYRSENPEKVKQSKQKWNSKHLDYHKQYSKQWNLKNEVKLKIKRKQWRSEHKEETNQQVRDKRKANPAFRTLCNLRSQLNNICKAQGVKKPLHTLESLGCTAIFFQNYLQSHFKPGMTKENNGKRKWIKHHIIRFKDVDLHNIEQFKKVCHYTNIIPMWEDEHIELHRKDRK